MIYIAMFREKCLYEFSENVNNKKQIRQDIKYARLIYKFHPDDLVVLCANNTNGEMVGFIILCTGVKKTRIICVAVRANCEGKKYGSRLVSACEKIAASHGCKTVSTLTKERLFYQKRGYNVVGTKNKQYVLEKVIG